MYLLGRVEGSSPPRAERESPAWNRAPYGLRHSRSTSRLVRSPMRLVQDRSAARVTMCTDRRKLTKPPSSDNITSVHEQCLIGPDLD